MQQIIYMILDQRIYKPIQKNKGKSKLCTLVGMKQNPRENGKKKNWYQDKIDIYNTSFNSFHSLNIVPSNFTLSHSNQSQVACQTISRMRCSDGIIYNNKILKKKYIN